MSGVADAAPLAVLASTRAVLTLADNSLVLSPATICMSPTTGKIVSVVDQVVPESRFPAGTVYVDHSPKLLLPGLVDAHVHLNEPGRTEWEGFWTGTRAAASGGVTTVIDMPLNAIPPTTTVSAFEEKLRASRGQCWVDVAFYGGLVPGNASHLRPLDAVGVRGFKGFLIESGVDEFPAVSVKDVAGAMLALNNMPTTLMFHAEMAPPEGDEAAQASPSGDPVAYQTFLDSRPATYETRAVEEIIALAHEAPSLHLHIVHLSAAECIPLLRAARARGVNITAETCFHYLALSAEHVAQGDTRHKCCPPIRDSKNRDALWEELATDDSCITTVVSDHSPCTPELKLLPEHLRGAGGEPKATTASDGSSESAPSGDFMAAWGGIASVGLGLPILHTAARQRGGATVTLTAMVRLCCQATAAHAGLSHRKGALRPGMDADVCVFDDAEAWTLAPRDMRWKNRCSPWEGRAFTGRVRETWLRGRKVFELGCGDGGFMVAKPFGEALTERRTA